MRFPQMTLSALVAGIAAVVGFLFVLPIAPAQADTTLLCKGFTDCARKGYGNYGYAAEYRQMHWRMYGGHNCTNYASFRMIKAGAPATRPWTGSGNASNWGIQLASKTDQTPSVGAVAWWRARNHVQVVEKVIDADTIVVSEDHWGGDFDWAVVRRGNGSNWPTGFVHIVDAPLTAVANPVVPATAQVGVPVTANPGSWPAGSSVAYQWLADGYPIPGATSPTYLPTAADAGKWLIFRVIASKSGYAPGKAYSAKTAPVALGTQQASGDLSVSGFPKVGGILTAQTPAISPTPASVTQQWFADGAAIPGATGTTLPLGPALLGKKISVVSTATQSGYQPLTLQSDPTEPTGPAQMVLQASPRLVGSPVEGSTLTLSPGSTNIPSAQLAYRWYRDGQMIRDAAGPTYRTQGADLGKHISVKVAWRKAGYPDIVVDRQTPIVRAVPQLRLVSTANRGVRVRILAPDAPGVWGAASLRLPDRRTRWANVAGGETTFTPAPTGRMTVRIAYGGNRFVLPGTWTVVVNVRS